MPLRSNAVVISPTARLRFIGCAAVVGILPYQTAVTRLAIWLLVECCSAGAVVARGVSIWRARRIWGICRWWIIYRRRVVIGRRVIKRWNSKPEGRAAPAPTATAPAPTATTPAPTATMPTATMPTAAMPTAAMPTAAATPLSLSADHR
jgi:hypothetical protein